MKLVACFSLTLILTTLASADVVFEDGFERLSSILVPFQGEPRPGQLQFDSNAVVAIADIYFLLDITGDMATVLDALTGSVVDLLEGNSCNGSGLSCASPSDCLAGQVCSGAGVCTPSPGMAGCVSNLWSGIGTFTATYRNELSLQPNPFATQAALFDLETSGSAEELFEALLGIAAPDLVEGETGCSGPTSLSLGCPSFRPDANRLVVAVTSEDNDGTTTALEAGSALASQGITLAGIWSGSAGSSERNDLRDVVLASGSVLANGTPLILDGAGSPAVISAAADLIEAALESSEARVSIEVFDDPTDSVDATMFIERFEVDSGRPECAALSTEDSDGDGFDDTYPAAIGGSKVCFGLVVAPNESVSPQATQQVFPVYITIDADGEPLETWKIDFIVPSQ
jgi:hypothetical protein